MKKPTHGGKRPNSGRKQPPKRTEFRFQVNISDVESLTPAEKALAKAYLSGCFEKFCRSIGK